MHSFTGHSFSHPPTHSHTYPCSLAFVHRPSNGTFIQPQIHPSIHPSPHTAFHLSFLPNMQSYLHQQCHTGAVADSSFMEHQGLLLSSCRRFERYQCFNLQGQAFQEENTSLLKVGNYSCNDTAFNPSSYHCFTPSLSRFYSFLKSPLLAAEKLKWISSNENCGTHNADISIFAISRRRLLLCQTWHVTRPVLFYKNMAPFTNKTTSVSSN